MVADAHAAGDEAGVILPFQQECAKVCPNLNLKNIRADKIERGTQPRAPIPKPLVQVASDT